MMSKSKRFLALPAPKMLWLLVSLALVLAPHVPRLPVWITGACVVLGIWRYVSSRRHWRSPGALVRLVLVGAAVAGVGATFGTVLGRDAGTALLVLMLGLKLLELNTHRDIMLFVFLGYFLVITNFLYSQSVFMAVYMFAAVLLLTGALVAVNHPGRTARPRLRLRQAGVLMIQALPFTLLLFLLFPRVAGPLWNLPADAHTGVSGFSETMSPGSITRLSRSNAVAFRAEFDDPLPDSSALYWRGLVFWQFDGQSWSMGPKFEGRSRDFVLEAAPVRYAVTVEPHNKRWLFALEMPATAPRSGRLTPSRQLVAAQPVRERLRYEVTSYMRYSGNGRLDPVSRERALRLPERGNPRSRELAREWRARFESDRQFIRRVLTMFRQQPFRYTLSPAPLGADPVDTFLFETRQGFCEHYASAFAVVLRAAGIPARVVAGYQGGEYNEVGDYMIVRQSDAHAWVEAWVDNRGWVRFDPTAAVSPERVETGIEGALPEQVVPGSFTRSANPGLRKLALMWDALNNSWNQWVLGYGPERQIQLLSALGFNNASWKEMAIGLIAGVSLLLVTLFLVMMAHYRRMRPDPVVATYRQFCNKLTRCGLQKQVGEGPMDYAERISARRPDLAGRTRRISQAYIALRYGRNPSQEQLRRFRQLVNGFTPRTTKKRRSRA